MLMLLFYVGKDAYACDTDDIIEVIPRIKTKHIPQMPPFFAGLISYAGISLPIIDFSRLIAERPSVDSMHTRIILFKNPLSTNEDQPLFGLIAEKVIETKAMDQNDFIYSEIKVESMPYLKWIINFNQISIQYVSISDLVESIKGVIATGEFR